MASENIQQRFADRFWRCGVKDQFISVGVFVDDVWIVQCLLDHQRVAFGTHTPNSTS